MEWIKCSERLPPKKDGWNHSERVLLWYEGSEYNAEDYGVGYYHYDPPYSKPGFTDFAHFGRQPNLWTYINPPQQ